MPLPMKQDYVDFISIAENLQEALADPDLLSDEEVLAEILKRGLNPIALAEETRAILREAVERFRCSRGRD